MKLRVFDEADGSMDYNMDSIFKNPSIIPSELLLGKDPLLRVMLSTEKFDREETEIYQGDIIELVNSTGTQVRVICEFGNAQRELVGGDEINLCEITGFYFRLTGTDRASYPIVNNYEGKSDYEIFKVIGNIYQNPELNI